MATKGKISEFNFKPGQIIGNKYRIVKRLAAGWEGEVYIVEEVSTGIIRAAKFFLPHRNLKNKSARFYAKKLHKLRNCSAIIQYHTQDTIQVGGQKVSYLISEFVDGETLEEFLNRQPGKRVSPFQAVHLLFALSKGVDAIHKKKEYHGDLHAGNVIIQRYGLKFDIKVIDVFHWGAATPENIREDVCDLIRIFYDALGGQKHYSKQPQEIKDIICGLKRTLILKKFKTAGQLRSYIKNMRWS